MAELIKAVKGPFTKADLVNLQKEINGLWNKFTNEPLTPTIGVVIKYNGKEDKQTWVEIPKTKPETIASIAFFKISQKPGLAK